MSLVKTWLDVCYPAEVLSKKPEVQLISGRSEITCLLNDLEIEVNKSISFLGVYVEKDRKIPKWELK